MQGAITVPSGPVTERKPLLNDIWAIFQSLCKKIVHPRMTIRTSFTHPCVLPNSNKSYTFAEWKNFAVGSLSIYIVYLHDMYNAFLVLH